MTKHLLYPETDKRLIAIKDFLAGEKVPAEKLIAYYETLVMEAQFYYDDAEKVEEDKEHYDFLVMQGGFKAMKAHAVFSFVYEFYKEIGGIA